MSRCTTPMRSARRAGSLAQTARCIGAAITATPMRRAARASSACYADREMAQALFANQREANLQSIVALVETVIGQLGYPTKPITEPNAQRGWQLAKGSATAKITIVDRTDFTHLRVCAVVMTLDAKVDRPALHAHLLDLNAGLCGSAFATAD